MTDIWPIDRLIPYIRNPRKNDAAVGQMCASIQEFGFKIPVLVRSSGEVVDGHLRIKAARKMGITDIPVILCDEWSEAQVKAFRLLVNRSVNWAEWDDDLVKLEMVDLKALEYDLSLTGFDSAEVAEFLKEATVYGQDEDAVPEVPATPVTILGDLWLLGEHRVLCGDSTDASAVARLMGGKKATLLATDPPYLVNYTGGSHPQSWSNSPEVKDKCWDSYKDPASCIEFYESFMRIGLEHLAKGGAVYQWHAALMQYLVHQAWLKCGLLVHQHIVWVKARSVLTHSHYMWQHEVAFYGWPKGNLPNLRPPANTSTVWQVNQVGESTGIHPTQKPVELARRPIEYHTQPHDICYEPFSGSGTMIAASEAAGRACYAMEIAPEFVDCAVNRWQEFTGKQATHDQTGLTFDALKAQRLGTTERVPDEETEVSIAR